MKIVFFDVDEITKNYLEKQKICTGDVVLLSESMENISPAQYEQVKDAEVISVFVHTALKMTNSSLDRYPNLKLIATRSTGYDHIDLNYCRQRGIEAVNVPKYGEATVAEFTFGVLLSLARHIIQARTDMKNNFVRMKEYTGFDLYGHTLGIIGTGGTWPSWRGGLAWRCWPMTSTPTKNSNASTTFTMFLWTNCTNAPTSLRCMRRPPKKTTTCSAMKPLPK